LSRRGLGRAFAAIALAASCGNPASRRETDATDRSAKSESESAAALEAEAVVSIDCGFTTEHCRPTPADSKAAAKLPGAFTLVTEVRLDGRPHERARTLTRWQDTHDNLAWELGIDEAQRPYLLLSDDGKLTRSLATSIHATQQLRLGKTYDLAAVVVPGTEVVFYLDGIEIHRQTEVVASIHVGSAKLGIRRRKRDENPSTAVIVGRARIFSRALSTEDVVALATAHGRRSTLPTRPTIRPLTSGPRFHWFGYYDKHELDPTDRYVLGMAVDFENRRVTPVDAIEIGMVDLHAGDEWVRLGESRAWNWQQGCMLQWIPHTDDEIIWNDRIGEGKGARFVARILDVGARTERLLPRPIYTITPDGTRALGIDFARLGRWRPTYGYVGAPDPTEGVPAPTDAGIYSMDLATGESEQIVSIAEVFATKRRAGAVAEHEHFIEMLQINDAGTRFLFYERWVLGRTNLEHRVFTADLDGSDLFMLSQKGMLSHVDWFDDRHIVIFSDAYDGYALFEDKVGYVSTMLPTRADGHQTFFEGGDWMLADTYADRYRLQHPFLFHLPTDEIFALADLLSPPEYKGIFRADTHPRLSRDERRVVLDSPHLGGRQMYMIEIGEILDAVAAGETISKGQ